MPVLLSDAVIEGWLDGSLGTDGLRLAAENELREWPVSRREGEDDPTIVEASAA